MGALILPPQHSAVADKLRFLQNAHGAVPSPFDCWLAQRGLKTLPLRMRAHGANAVAVARALRASPLVKDVIYPGLGSHPRSALARRMLAPHARTFVDGGSWRVTADAGGTGSPGSSSDSLADGADAADFPYGGMISFRIAGGGRAAETFLRATRLFALAESLGGVESLAELPAAMTHGSIPAAERAVLGIGEDLIRLSVGVEDAEDLVRDVLQALEVAHAEV
jgi:cystathionine gamma-lyase